MVVTCLKDKLGVVGYIVEYKSKEKIREFIVSIRRRRTCLCGTLKYTPIENELFHNIVQLAGGPRITDGELRTSTRYALYRSNMRLHFIRSKLKDSLRTKIHKT